MKYFDFTQRIRRFTRTSVLGHCTNLSWYIWNTNPPGVRDPQTYQDRTLFLARAYAGKIAAICAAVGNEHRSQIATIDSVGKLCHQVLEIEEPILDELTLKEQEFEPLKKYLNLSAWFKEFCNDDGLVRFCSIRLFMARLLRSQSEPQLLSERDVISSWGILERVFRKDSALEKKLTRALQVEPLVAMRSGLCFLSMFSHNNTGNPPGRLELANSTVEQDVRSGMNIDLDVLRLIANRWAWTCEDFRVWHESVMELPAHVQKYSPHPLVRAPFIKLDSSFENVSKEGASFLSPSPWHILWKTNYICHEGLRDCTNQQESMSIQSSIGDATSEFLFEALSHICGKESVRSVDEVFCEGGKRADFLISAGDSVMIVECKKSISNVETKSIHSPEQVVVMWERIAEGFSQCASTINSESIRRLFPNSKFFISIVCVNDFLISEGGIFNLFAHNANWYESHHLKYPEIATQNEFLEALVRYGPQTVASEIVKRWDEIRDTKSSLDHSFSTYFKRLGIPENQYSDHSYLANLERELFPFVRKLHFGRND